MSEYNDGAPEWRDLGSRRITKARKHHPCDGCPDGYIKPGEDYSLHVGLLDGVFTVQRLCARTADYMTFGSGYCPRERDYDAKAARARARAEDEATRRPLGPDELAF